MKMAVENLLSRGREAEPKFIQIEILRVTRITSIKNPQKKIAWIAIGQHLLL
jgi:hypothetical protein